MASLIRKSQLPRLLYGMDSTSSAISLSSHLELWGERPTIDKRTREDFFKLLEESGLRGHGGAWFPVGAKWRSVSNNKGLRSPVVVANGSEGEPASEKDRLLISRAPHLVLDGLAIASEALNASSAYICVHEDLTDIIGAALSERKKLKHKDPHIEVVAIGDAFIAGEESALVNYINGGPTGVPTYKGVTSIREKGVKGKPTLVQNVETLAHVGVLSRLGVHDFRSIGTTTMPGSTLVSVVGAVNSPGVIEVALGVPIGDIITKAGGAIGNVSAILLGGYGGNWIAPNLSTPIAEDQLRNGGLTMGASVVGVVNDTICPLHLNGAILSYLVSERARQCGSCEFGLPSISQRWNSIANGQANKSALNDLLSWCDSLEGRGACHHPDGAIKLVKSALNVFRDDIGRHLRGGNCNRSKGYLNFPIPNKKPIRVRRAGLNGVADNLVLNSKVLVARR